MSISSQPFTCNTLTQHSVFKKGKWSREEDELLSVYVKTYNYKKLETQSTHPRLIRSSMFTQMD